MAHHGVVTTGVPTRRASRFSRTEHPGPAGQSSVAATSLAVVGMLTLRIVIMVVRSHRPGSRVVPFLGLPYKILNIDHKKELF